MVLAACQFCIIEKNPCNARAWRPPGNLSVSDCRFAAMSSPHAILQLLTPTTRYLQVGSLASPKRPPWQSNPGSAKERPSRSPSWGHSGVLLHPIFISHSVGGTMKFRPLHDRVVVKRIDAEDKSAGGIIIPDTAKEKPSQGEVIAVGPGGRNDNGKLIAIDLKAGDRVLFGKWSGTEVKIDGQELLIMKESDIMGVLDEPVARKKAA